MQFIALCRAMAAVAADVANAHVAVDPKQYKKSW